MRHLAAALLGLACGWVAWSTADRRDAERVVARESARFWADRNDGLGL